MHHQQGIDLTLVEPKAMQVKRGAVVCPVAPEHIAPWVARPTARCTDWRRDRLSRALVTVGGGVFLGFCLLSLMSLSIAG
jgi:hypothetical protein